MSGRPQIYGEEETTLRTIDPNYENYQDEEADEENEMRMKMARKQNMIQGMDEQMYGLTEGKGMLRPPNAIGRGYISPQATGGWIFPLLMGLTSLLGKGMKRGGKAMPYRPIMLHHPPNLTSASSFYRDIAHQATGQGISHKTFEALFGDKKAYRDMITGKTGSGIRDKLLMGHLLAPLVHNHLKKALKGTGMAPEKIMSAIEDKLSDVFDQAVTPDVMARGGSVLGSLWNGVKGIFGKILPFVKSIFSNPKVREIGQNVIGKIGDVASKQAPEIAEMAANRIASYAKRKLKGDEPPADMDDEDIHTPSATRKFEQPSAAKDSSYRKKIIAERALVPRDDDTQKERKIIGWNWGQPVYGDGIFDSISNWANKNIPVVRKSNERFANKMRQQRTDQDNKRREADYQVFRERMNRETTNTAGVGLQKKRPTRGGAWSVKLVRE